MTQYIIKVLITTALVVAVSEVAKRSTLIGGLVASLPVLSLLAMIWLYIDTKMPAGLPRFLPASSGWSSPRWSSFSRSRRC